MYRRLIKPLLDFLFAFIGIILCLPLFILISLYCAINFNGLVFFTQQRIGKNEKTFTIYKFITMHPPTGNYKNKPDAERLTKAGALLRLTSLDELPQLFNIISGKMSWVGPRPLLPEYLPFYTNEEKKRHQVKPGITGLAQINGRNLAGWDQRLQLDAQYAKKVSLLLDLQIVLRTAIYIIQRRDVVANPQSVLLPLHIARKLNSPNK